MSAKMNKYIITFGSSHLEEIRSIVNPMNIMLIVEAPSHGQAREMVINSFIGDKFATSYEYDKAEEFKTKYNMFECKFENLIKYVEAEKKRIKAIDKTRKTYYELMENK